MVMKMIAPMATAARTPAPIQTGVRELDVVLPAGTYECTAYFHNLDPETGDIIGTAGAIINITIKN